MCKRVRQKTKGCHPPCPHPFTTIPREILLHGQIVNNIRSRVFKSAGMQATNISLLAEDICGASPNGLAKHKQMAETMFQQREVALHPWQGLQPLAHFGV